MSNKILTLLALCICMMGCGDQSGNVEVNPTDYVMDTYHPLQIVELNGCQYFYGPWGNATVLTHKGDCNNPIHIHNGGNHE